MKSYSSDSTKLFRWAESVLKTYCASQSTLCRMPSYLDHHAVVPIFKNVPTLYGNKRFLDAFTELRKATINFVMSSCLFVSPSNRMGKLASYWTDFHEIWLNICRISVEKFQASLKSDKNCGYFAWRAKCINNNNNTSLNSFLNEKCFRKKLRE